MKRQNIILSAMCLLMSSSINAADAKKMLSKKEALKLSSISNRQNNSSKKKLFSASSYQAFTGKVVGSKVRVRLQADSDATIVQQLNKNDLVVIKGEKNGFYVIEAPSSLKAYIYRSFVLDNVVEANRVNVRVAPELDAPILAHLNTGDKVHGDIFKKNAKWLEIAPPSQTELFVAKEFIEYVGGPDFKDVYENRKLTVAKLIEDANKLSLEEMGKDFETIRYDYVVSTYEKILKEFKDFPTTIAKAQEKLLSFKDNYLQRKLAYLETRSQTPTKALASNSSTRSRNITDSMKKWQSVEQAVYLSWSAMHHAKNMDDFYEEQKTNSIAINGVIRQFQDPVKNKPGDFLIVQNGTPRGYIYSTQVNLSRFVGKQVKVVAAPRPNNDFAFPAYFVLDVVQ